MRSTPIVAATLLLLTMLSPTVAAQDVQVQLEFVADPDSDIYDEILNVANTTEQYRTNYNRTWVPFFDKYPDAEGVTVTPFMPSAIVRQNSSTLSAVQRIRFTDDHLMGGSSISWWRSPLGAIPFGATVNVQIFRSDSFSNSVSTLSATGPVFTDPLYTQQIWNFTGDTSLTGELHLRSLDTGALPDMAQVQWSNLSATIEDAVVYEENPTVNDGASGAYSIGRPAPYTRRSFVSWDTSALPADAIVLNANLTLKAFSYQGPVGQTFELRKVMQSWLDSTVTWNNQPSALDLVAQAITEQMVALREYPFNVTELLNWDLTAFGPGQSRGLRLAYRDESMGPNSTFLFRANSFFTPIGLRPQLWVQWAPATVGYNLTYAKVFAPLFINKDYYAYWRVSGMGAQSYHAYFTPNDVGNNDNHTSWLRVDSVVKNIPVDLDQSVVLIRGMANGIAGLAATCAPYGLNCTAAANFLVHYNTTFSTVVNNGPLYTYANVVHPAFVRDPDSGNAEAILRIVPHDSLGATYVVPDATLEWDDTESMTVESFNLSAVAGLPGKTVVRIDYRWDIISQNTNISFWLSATSRLADTIVTMDTTTTDQSQTAHFAVFGYFNIDGFFYTNTDLDIILYTVEEPDTEFGIAQLWARLKAQIEEAQDLCNFDTLLTDLATISGLSDFAQELISRSPAACIVQRLIEGAVWVFNTVFGRLGEFFSPVLDILFIVGGWIWQALTFLVKAIEWFLFWGVKLINVFIVAAVFAIAFLSPSYVGRGLYEWAKSGYDGSVLRDVLRRGWERVWSVIQLIISLVIVALSAIAAVLPL